MGQMDLISSNFIRIYFAKLSGEHCADHTHVTDAYADQSPLLTHFNLMDKQWRHTDSDQRIYPCAV